MLTALCRTVKDVHKAPALDLVGWFTITPKSGPEASQLAIHRQILQDYNENAVLLAFHPSQVQSDSAASGAKLPLTVYESIFEGDHAGDGDKAMQLDGEERGLPIRFRELPYSVETGETEMISVDFVARGGGNAMAVETTAAPAATKAESAANKKKRPGKKDDEMAKEDEKALLSPEDEDRKWLADSFLFKWRT
jgi:COP9 signalosome complex subunit 6